MTNRFDVVAIDPSLTGLAVVSASLDYEEYEEFSSEPAKTLIKRVRRFEVLSTKVVDIMKATVPRLCLIEGYAYASKGSSGISLAEFGGILRSKIMGYADLTVEVPPMLLKKYITGKGNASKVAVVSALSSKHGIIFKSDNHADAFGLSRLGLAALGLIETRTKYEREAVSVVQGLMEKETQ